MLRSAKHNGYAGAGVVGCRMRVLALGLLVVVAFAGCSSSGGQPIEVTPDGTGYKFHSGLSADNYTWDFGDHAAPGYGRDATHTYAFPNGQLTVKLTTRSGGAATDNYAPLVLGNGQNQAPTFILKGNTNWTVTGETFRLSAAASSDPDHDPLLFAWSCLRERDIQRLPVHTHPPPPGGAGVRFDTPPAGLVTAILTKEPLPAPDHTFSADLCDGLGTAATLGHDQTIEGKFQKSGLYLVTLLATDGKIPTTAGRWEVYVSTPGERPNPIVAAHMEGKLLGGSQGQVQDQTTPLPAGQTFDRNSTTFSDTLAANPTYVNFTFDAGPAGVNKAHWVLERGDRIVQQGDANGVVGRLEPGVYQLAVVLDQGANVAYTVDVQSHLILDPLSIY